MSSQYKHFDQFMINYMYIKDLLNMSVFTERTLVLLRW
ncbi:hypothetical protein KP78_11300 [Jeotgalibacillus soli]|uniref:Uncharacterized protein n=1 Tax=Jeotgalibacillus soli TaxID=889306 RepID=A0A0C2VL81_9BACL|nr:hypothetical protein KP78_11300 [Jeotgalibacillus soli]